MNINTIDLKDIYFDTEKGNRRSLKSFTESIVNKLYKKKKINDESYRSLGGAKEYNVHKYEMLYETDKHKYGNPVICQTCKNQDNKKAATDNLVGFKCFATLTKDTTTYNIKTSCLQCKRLKNSYVSIDKFPSNIKKDILENEKKIRKTLF